MDARLKKAGPGPGQLCRKSQFRTGNRQKTVLAGQPGQKPSGARWLKNESRMKLDRVPIPDTI